MLLRQPLVVHQAGLTLRRRFPDEQPADDLALGFGIIDARQRGEIAIRGIDANDLDAHSVLTSSGGHRRHDLIAFVPAQQTRVDEYACELIADRPLEQCGNHGRIDAAGESEQQMIVANLFANACNGIVDNVRRRPQRLAAANIDDEAAQDFGAVLRVRDLGVKLHAVPAIRFIGHCRDRQVTRARGNAETRGHGCYPIAVRHPDIELPRQSGEQRDVTDDAEVGVAELARVFGLGPAAELHRHRLHAIADAEQRTAAVEYTFRCTWRLAFRRRLRATGEDDALRCELRNLVRIVIPSPDFAVHADLADATRNQLRVLRAEVEDQDLVAVDVLHRDSGSGLGTRDWEKLFSSP